MAYRNRFSAIRLRTLAGTACAALAAAAAPLLGAPLATVASVPYIKLAAEPGARVAPASCDPSGPAPVVSVHLDLGDTGTYRYSPAYVVPYYFDDEGEFNLIWNQDATLIVSDLARIDGVRYGHALPLAPLSAWYAAFGRVPEHTELALRVAAYDSTGRAVAASRITWDCTTGVVRTVEHRGNAAAHVPVTSRLVEYYNAALDHYFVTADGVEKAALDAGTHAGWQRTGLEVAVYLHEDDAPASTPVCRFYLPPGHGDSHFYSASPAECEDVRARFPAFAYEAAEVFRVQAADAVTGACPAATRPVYRLWNTRADSNHRYTADALVRSRMIAKGYVPEGYGPDAVAFCALP